MSIRLGSLEYYRVVLGVPYSQMAETIMRVTGIPVTSRELWSITRNPHYRVSAQTATAICEYLSKEFQRPIMPRDVKGLRVWSEDEKRRA